MSGKEPKPKPEFEPALKSASEETTKTFPYAPKPKEQGEPLESITSPMGTEKTASRAESSPPPKPVVPGPSIQTVTTVFEGSRESAREKSSAPPAPPAPHAHHPPPVEAPMPSTSARGLPPPPPSLRATDPRLAATLPAPMPARAPSVPVSAAKKKEETTQPRFTMLTWTPVDRSCYRIEGVFAQGGIGRILKAYDLRLNRTVAVKELLAPKGEAKERFAREVYLTARLQHPSIVPVYEAGRWHDGEPFYAMKLVSGRSMLDRIEEAKSLEQRLALVPHVLAVAEAMAYAHAKKTIHRDLKPANVMIGEFGETIVIDWGLAKELGETGVEVPDGDSTIRHKLTNAGAVVGTPAYMPPEQAMGHPVDERADVYSIGALLYHVLTGQPPYDGKSIGEVLKKLVSQPPVPIEKHVRGVPGELRAITEKAMARHRDQRYTTARELAADLRSFSTGQMISVERHSPAAIVRRFLKRYRTALALTIFFVALLSALGAYSVQRVIKARDSAALSEANAVLRSEQWMLAHIRSLLARDPNEAAAWMKQIGSGSPVFGHLRTLLADAKAKGVATVLRGHTGPLSDIAFSPDGKMLVTLGEDRSLKLWDAATFKAQTELAAEGDAASLFFSPDAKQLVVYGKDGGLGMWTLRAGAADKNIEKQKYSTQIRLNWSRLSPDGKSVYVLVAFDGLKIWEWATGKETKLMAIKGRERGADLSPDGNTIGFCADGDALIFDLRTGSRRSLPAQESPCTAVLFSQDGKTLGVGAEDGALRFFNTEDGKRIQKAEAHKGEVRRMLLMKDGRRYLSYGADNSLRITDSASGETKLIGKTESALLNIVRSPNSDVFATIDGSSSLNLWHPEAGPWKTLGGFRDAITQVAFSPDGRNLAASSRDHSARLWRIDQISDRILYYSKAPITHLRILSDGRHAAIASENGRVGLVRLSDGEFKELGVHSGKLKSLLISPDGKYIASAGEDGTVRAFDADFSNSRERIHKGHTGAAISLAWLKGPALLSAGTDKKLLLWDLNAPNPEPAGELSALPKAMIGVSGGSTAALGDESGTVYVFSAEGKTLRVLGKHLETVSGFDYSPEKNRLISGSKDKSLRLWNWEGGADRTIDTQGPPITNVLFGGQGEWLASYSGTGSEIRLWETASGRSKAMLPARRGAILSMAISPEGRRLLSANADRSIQLWDIEHQEQRVLTGHSGEIKDLAFAPDGKTFVSVSADGTIRSWADDLPSDEASLRTALTELSQESILIEGFENTIGIKETKDTPAPLKPAPSSN